MTKIRDEIANLLQARLSWRQAEACADDIVSYFRRNNYYVIVKEPNDS